MAKVQAVWLLALALGGCRGASEFPLSEGRAWTYAVRSDFITRVEQVKVVREVPVAGVSGWELGGPLGVSRLAWKDDVLVAERMVNASFDPAIPLLVAGGEKVRRTWHGKLGSLAGEIKANAVLDQEPESKRVDGRTVETIRATLTVRAGPDSIELVTWYRPGLGPIRQTQHTNGRFDVELTAIGGS